MENYTAKINECASVLKSKITNQPKTAFVLGTGLGKLVDEMTDQRIFPYADLPYFPKSTVVGHKGQLVFGKLKGKDVVMLQGRFHFYEGYSMKEVVFSDLRTKSLGGRNPHLDQCLWGRQRALSTRRHRFDQRFHQHGLDQPADRDQR